jgi:CBS domain-containing protein
MSATTTHGSYLMPSLEHATVADAMHPGVMTCDPDAPLIDVARMMASHHVHCIAVLGETGDSLAWGIISDLDMIRAGIDFSGQVAATMAMQPVLTVELSTPLIAAARKMLSQGTSHALVVDPREHRPVGILSTLDIAGVLAWGEA